MFKNTSFIFLFLLQSFILNAQKINYLGDNLIDNLSYLYNNVSDTVAKLKLKQGQVLELGKKGKAFVAKDVLIFIEPMSQKEIIFSAYTSRIEDVFPDTTEEIILTDRIDTNFSKILGSIEDLDKVGREAQIYLWSEHLKEKLDKNLYVYSFRSNIIFESNENQQIKVLAVLDSMVIDTLFKKTVSEGFYTLNFGKNILSKKSEKDIWIVNQEGKILYKNGKWYSIEKERNFLTTFAFDSPRPMTGINLIMVDSKRNIQKDILSDIKLPYGIWQKSINFDYKCSENDTLILQLINKKGKVLYQELVSFTMIQERIKTGMNEARILKIVHKYGVRRPENRTVCTIENAKGEVLAEVFKNKNIHSGPNKVEYKYTHRLKDDDSVWLFVRTPSGKVLTKQEFKVYSR